MHEVITFDGLANTRRNLAKVKSIASNAKVSTVPYKIWSNHLLRD